MERRNFLGRITAGAAGAGLVGAIPAIGQVKGPVAQLNAFKAADFGAAGDGVADDTAALQRAIDEASRIGGATIHLSGSAGRRFKCSGTLSFDNKRGVTLIGNTGPNVGEVSELLYTGKTGPFISMKSCFSITFEGVHLSYNNPSFAGSLVLTGHSKEAKADPGYLLFDRCTFTGTGSASGAEYLLNLSYCIISTVRSCSFVGSRNAIGGRVNAAYSNAIQITESTFLQQSNAPIRNAGEAWLISGCTFEPLSTGKAGAFKQDSGLFAIGLTIIGCWMGDALKPGGCWIDLSTGAILGLSIVGNRIAAAGAGPTDTCIKIGNGNQGVSITGNRIEGHIAIDFVSGYTFGATITGNDLQAPVPIAHLERALPHFVAGHYTTDSYLSGTAHFMVGAFAGNQVRGSVQLVPQPFPPTKPEDGDMWSNKQGMFIKINGVIKRVVLE